MGSDADQADATTGARRTMSHEPVLEARRVTKIFGGRAANDGVNITCQAGRVHALLGENGSGKTTLVSILCGQYQPESGEIYIHGRRRVFRSPADAMRAGVGVVHQDLRVVASFTVAENIVLGTRDRPNRVCKDRISKLARELGFGVDPEARVASLGVGEIQQVEILKLLYRGLEILILDEPTAVLTPQQSEELFKALRQLANQGKTIVVITHRLREVEAGADWVTVLRRGRVVGDGPISAMNSSTLASLMVGTDVPRVVETRAGTTGQVVLAMAGVGCIGSRGERHLTEVDLAIRGGEIVGIAGISGNGQRELADVAAGTRAADLGMCQVATSKRGYIPEDRLADALVGQMSIAENLVMRRYRDGRLGGRFWMHSRRVRDVAKSMVEEYDIPAPDIDAPVASLSGGALQRVVVARELSESPDLLVACQPTRGLDIRSTATVWSQLLDVRSRGAAVLLISEDLDELLTLADRIHVLCAGKVSSAFFQGEVDRARLGLAMTGVDAVMDL